MRKLFLNSPLFVYLFPLFFYTSTFVEHVKHINWKSWSLSLLIFSLVVFIAHGVLVRTVFRKDHKRSAILFVFILFFYAFFAEFKPFLKALKLPRIFLSYKFQLIFIIAILLFLYFLLKSRRVLSAKLFAFLNILICVLIIVQLVLGVQKKFSAKISLSAPPLDINKVEKKPNVYFLLFDEYAGNRQLEDWFDFENEALRQFFEDRNILYKEGFRSNYNYTLLSMNSIFNLDYVNREAFKPWNDYSFTLKSFDAIKESRLPKFFEESGYEFRNLSLYDIGKHERFYKIRHHLKPLKIMNDRMFHSKLKKELSVIINDESSRWYSFFHLDKMYFKKAHDEIFSETVRQSRRKDKPRFVYSHFLLPHSPFEADSLGNEIDVDIFALDFDAYASYKQNLIQANRYIKGLYDSILTYDPKSIIVCSGDHGFRKHLDSVHSYAFSTMFSIHLPEEEYAEWDSVQTLINVFPSLLNTQFGQDLPLHKDSAFFRDVERNTFEPMYWED